MPCYFFSGNQYIRVTRGQTGPGSVDPGYPAPISNWGWGAFGAHGIDAALYSGPVDYFFSGKEYIRVTRGNTGPGKVDPGYPAPISNWGWGAFGANGIDAALYSGPKDYFFSGKQYIRVTRGDTGPGKVDPGYPAPISNWGWGAFGANGIDAALNSGPVDYFFSGKEYIRVTRGDTGPGKVDPGYPAPISNWGWKEFGASGIHGALFSGTDTVSGSYATGQVLVQSNNPSGNQILVYNRAADGSLTSAQAPVNTGGNGGMALNSPDSLASQGSLVHDATHGLVFAVNAGNTGNNKNSVSVLSLNNGILQWRQTLSSGGTFPVSLTVHGNIVYVLNAKDGGSISGYLIDSYNVVSSISGSTVQLNLGDTSVFSDTPGQIGFTPDGSHLVITTKTHGTILFIAVNSQGQPGAVTINPANTPLPFGFTFDQQGHLVVTDAENSALTTYNVNSNGTIQMIESVKNMQSATCWVAGSGGFYYVANAGSSTLSGYSISAGVPALLPGSAGVRALTGPVDLAVTPDGKYLYSLAGGSPTINVFVINPSNGTLGPGPSLSGEGLTTGMEGIVAT